MRVLGALVWDCGWRSASQVSRDLTSQLDFSCSEMRKLRSEACAHTCTAYILSFISRRIQGFIMLSQYSSIFLLVFVVSFTCSQFRAFAHYFCVSNSLVASVMSHGSSRPYSDCCWQPLQFTRLSACLLRQTVSLKRRTISPLQVPIVDLLL